MAMTMYPKQIIFLPSYYVIISHLLLHFVEELTILDPIHACLMYYVEQIMASPKNHV